eukprot:6858044-Karenia_brevis.AAC.1
MVIDLVENIVHGMTAIWEQMDHMGRACMTNIKERKQNRTEMHVSHVAVNGYASVLKLCASVKKLFRS